MTWTTRQRSEIGGLAAIVAGTGPLIVLVHGVGLRADAWAPVIDCLSTSHKVVAPDLPGHGASPFSSGLQTLTGYSEAIATLLSEPAIIVGHSLGAMIALDCATRFPERVTAVAALNAVFERSALARKSVQQRASSLDGQSVSDPGATLERWFGSAPSLAREACRDWLISVEPKGYQAAYSVFASENGPNRSVLASLNMPALFITGAKDPNSTPEMSRQMADLAPRGQAVIVSDAAHMMPMTHVEDTVEAIRDLTERAAP
ncbi:MAG: alpha/beta hydrolase [Pseudomonadota bacterium]